MLCLLSYSILLFLFLSYCYLLFVVPLSLFLHFFYSSYFYSIVFCFFFFKQKTAYEMRISDWSSDVCSSDLLLCRAMARGRDGSDGAWHRRIRRCLDTMGASPVGAVSCTSARPAGLRPIADPGGLQLVRR